MKSKKTGSAAVPIILILLSVGILIGVFLYVFDPLKGYFEKRDAQRISDLEKVSQALSYYYRDFGKYPDFVDGEYTMRTRDKQYRWGEAWKPYLNLLPTDPAFYKTYAYWVDRENNFQSYRLYTALDRPDLIESSCGEEGCVNAPQENMCGTYAPCNFGITSGNISP